MMIYYSSDARDRALSMKPGDARATGPVTYVRVRSLYRDNNSRTAYGVRFSETARRRYLNANARCARDETFRGNGRKMISRRAGLRNRLTGASCKWQQELVER